MPERQPRPEHDLSNIYLTNFEPIVHRVQSEPRGGSKWKDRCDIEPLDARDPSAEQDVQATGMPIERGDNTSLGSCGFCYEECIRCSLHALILCT